MDLLIRQNRAPYPTGRRWGKTAPWDLGISPDSQRSADAWMTLQIGAVPLAYRQSTADAAVQTPISPG